MLVVLERVPSKTILIFSALAPIGADRRHKRVLTVLRQVLLRATRVWNPGFRVQRSSSVAPIPPLSAAILAFSATVVLCAEAFCASTVRGRKLPGFAILVYEAGRAVN